MANTRCDCLTDTHAIEFDFGDHWSEAVRAKRLLCDTNWQESGDCSDIGNNERQKILDSVEHHHRTL